MSAGRIVLLVFGILIVIVSFGLMVSGGVILAVDNNLRDAQGFYSTGLVSVTGSSPAIITRSADIQLEPGWFMRRNNPVTLKVEASNVSLDKPIFVGVAPESDLPNYLNGVSYDEVSDFTFRPYHVGLTHHAGAATAPPPSTQNFWVASASGAGTQIMQWNVTSGSYSLVVMNADGSPPVNARVSLGVRIPGIVQGVGLGLLIGGIVLLVIGGVMIYLAARGR